MKLSVVQESFAKALGLVSRIIPPRPSLNVLNNVALSTDKNRLKISATNLEMAIVCTLGAKIEKDGSLTVPGKILAELISGIQSSTLSLVSSGNNLRVNSSNVDSLINGISAEEFPLIPEIKPKATIKLPIDTFNRALAQVSIAAAIDEARPVLNGVLVNLTNQQITLTATDSYRLTEVKLPYDSKEELSVIIPIRAIIEIMRILSSAKTQTLDLQIAENEAVFKVDNIAFITRLIEGKYPQYQQIITQNPTTSTIVNRDSFIEALKVAALFARESANTIKLSVTKKLIKIKSSASEIGENTSEIEAKTTGEPIEIQLNVRYLLDSLNTLSSQNILLELSGGLSPCIIRPVQTKDKTQACVHVIMPLRS